MLVTGSQRALIGLVRRSLPDGGANKEPPTPYLHPTSSLPSGYLPAFYWHPAFTLEPNPMIEPYQNYVSVDFRDLLCWWKFQRLDYTPKDLKPYWSDLMTWTLIEVSRELKKPIKDLGTVWRINIQNEKTRKVIDWLWQGLTISEGDGAPTFVDLELQDPRAAALLGTPNVEAIPRMLTKYADAFG
ncbi:hypothetical protein NUW58_g3459 [Xylaria curta]|uniref:Uncharacterized protein n=1 Tax=Xylaria curta TaxID=42375 RepID=A0ACC1PE00_9PEZI|nr:hypothetical protein NUW58_g3459 [Xylaria curta]